MAIAHHTGDGKVDPPTRLHVRKKLFAEISRIAAEIVVGVDAYHRVEKLLFERQTFRCIGLDGVDLPIRHAHSAKESAVLGGVAPQVDGVHVEPVLAREHHACDAGTGSEVAYARPFRKVGAAKQLFAELERVRPHDF